MEVIGSHPFFSLRWLVLRKIIFMKPTIVILSCLISMQSFAQENLGYQKPPKEILDLVDFERAPIVQFNPDRDMMLLLFRDGYKSIADLSRKELRLAGLRIDPKTNIGSRVRYYNNVKIRFLEGKNQDPQEIAGLPSTYKL